MSKTNYSLSLLKSLWKRLRRNDEKIDINVYFISGMCYNCAVFDNIKLPIGYKKVYIEWHTPRPDESLTEYAHTMAQKIDTSSPFTLVGYSFGAVIMQEMSLFLQPEKSIIISSFKREEEIPTLFRAVKRVNLTERLPMSLYYSTDFITNAFNQFVYQMPTSEVSQFMIYTDPVYVKWAVKEITNWTPNNNCKHLYHIHGTDDQIFPYELIRNAFPVQGGDHLMVLKKADTVSLILGSILLMNE
ncbi:alpha/beta hydrolase [Dysgonomonas sp. ZJ279]|uniref:alpha/beta hydrolase n=1 Tax=Dysgonomonas sp. ZJ279 TaxID=2709796 RepID=UPI0013EB4A49|nr:alpha/beta hydrolase [Dysgonomonas sp. ZJ279]